MYEVRVELELDNEINLLDLTLIKYNNRFHYKIYREPATMDSVIHADSLHPFTQKIATFLALYIVYIMYL